MEIKTAHKITARFAVLLGILSTPLVIMAQSSTNVDIPRLANGRPDLQGTWGFRTITPFQRPSELAGKKTLTAEEQAGFRLEELGRRDRANFTATTTPGDYNAVW